MIASRIFKGKVAVGKRLDMRSSILIAIASCIFIGCLGVSNAGALAWFGFSEGCFLFTQKGGSVKDGELTVYVENYQVEAACTNIESPNGWQPGVGNSGGEIIKVNTTSADPNKNNGEITAYGCIDLSKYDHRVNGEMNPAHVGDGFDNHICHPHDNTNKEEITGSTVIWLINATYELYSNGQLRLQGSETCTWNGLRDEDTGLPITAEENCKPCTETNSECPCFDGDDSTQCADACTFTCDTTETKVKGGGKH